MTLDELAAFLAAWAQDVKFWKREFGEVRSWLIEGYDPIEYKEGDV